MRPLLLVTNDDGIGSPGLHAAAQAAQGLGDLLIAAPRSQQTAMGRSFPRNAGTGAITRRELEVGGQRLTAYEIEGSPAQVVAHAVLELADRLPALCISGVNYGANVGLAITASGTVGAALEAYAYGVPGLAVSLESSTATHSSERYASLDWAAARYFTRHLASRVLRSGLPTEVAILNVNLPSDATDRTQIVPTRQSARPYFTYAHPGPRDLASPFRLRLVIDDLVAEEGSDLFALARLRAVSVTPLSWSMTAGCDIGDLVRVEP